MAICTAGMCTVDTSTDGPGNVAERAKAKRERDRGMGGDRERELERERDGGRENDKRLES